MDELVEKFYNVLVSHSHEIVMANDWLVLLAEELAEAAQPRVQRTAIQPAPIEEFVRDLKNYIESDDD